MQSTFLQLINYLHNWLLLKLSKREQLISEAQYPTEQEINGQFSLLFNVDQQILPAVGWSHRMQWRHTAQRQFQCPTKSSLTIFHLFYTNPTLILFLLESCRFKQLSTETGPSAHYIHAELFTHLR